MRVLSRRVLKDFWKRHSDAEGGLKSWLAEVEAADWKTPADVKASYRSASILQDSRVVFNICGNKYRLIVWINFDFHTVYIRFLGTHKDYDKVDAQRI